MPRWLTVLVGMLSVVFLSAMPLGPVAGAAEAPIGRLGDTLRVQNGDIIADVTLVSVAPSDIPPGWGNPPKWPHYQVYKAVLAVHAVQVPNPYKMSVAFSFRGVTPTGDAYEPRNTDAPDDLRPALQGAVPGSTVGGAVYWDAYRDPPSNVVLIDKQTGFHLAQWNL
jgi:hypothetical protein